MALEVDNSELLRVLKPSLPLERLHLDSYHSQVSDATLELISQQYNKTLTHFLLLRDYPGFPDLSDSRNEDPLVLLAWRCTQLAVLVVHGESALLVQVIIGAVVAWCPFSFSILALVFSIFQRLACLCLSVNQSLELLYTSQTGQSSVSL